MGSAGATKVILHILNVVSVVLGLAIAAASIWFFVQVHEFTSLRNSNHYLLDYSVYWPQAIPWIFLICAVFVISVSCCGFTSVKKSKRGLLNLYIIFSGIVIVCLIAAAVVALVFADSKSSDDFVQDTVWDVYFQSKTNEDVAVAFGNIERKLHCCGVDSPRDYKNWKNEFPKSCCDVYYHGFLEPYVIDCDITNKLANERHGCSAVAAQYARITIKVLSGGAVFTALIEVLSLLAALSLSRTLMKKKERIVAAQHESESKKVLL